MTSPVFSLPWVCPLLKFAMILHYIIVKKLWERKNYAYSNFFCKKEFKKTTICLEHSRANLYWALNIYYKSTSVDLKHNCWGNDKHTKLF